MPVNTTADSGLACLTAMLRFHGVAVDPGQLLHRFAGCVFGPSEIIRGAREHGLKAKLRAVRTGALHKLPLPAVVRRSDGAFLVLAKLVDGNVLLHDPVSGRPISKTLVEFASMWSGSIILMARRAQLSDLARRFDISWFLQAMHKYRRLLGEVLLASFFLQVFALVTPLFFQVVIDKVLVHRGLTTLDVLVVGLLVVATFESLLAGLRTHIFAHTVNRPAMLALSHF